MAFSAVWTLYDVEGKPLQAVRCAHVPTGGAQDMERCLSRDLDVLLARRPDLRLVTLADGAPEMQGILDRVVSNRVVAAQLVDFWHCAEHLGEAIAATGRYKDDTLNDWKVDLLERDEAIDDILVILRGWSMAYMLQPIDAMPKGLYDALTYLLNNGDRMRYATAHKAGLPVGSGTVEATGKTIVEVRMKRSGCRWVDRGAQALLGLRSLATSEPKRWNGAVAHVLASYTHQVTCSHPVLVASGDPMEVLRAPPKPRDDQDWNRTRAKWRNQALAWILERLQLAQGEGQGIPTIVRTMREEGCPPPTFDANEGRVRCASSAPAPRARARAPRDRRGALPR